MTSLFASVCAHLERIETSTGIIYSECQIEACGDGDKLTTIFRYRACWFLRMASRMNGPYQCLLVVKPESPLHDIQSHLSICTGQDPSVTPSIERPGASFMIIKQKLMIGSKHTPIIALHHEYISRVLTKEVAFDLRAESSS